MSSVSESVAFCGGILLLIFGMLGNCSAILLLCRKIFRKRNFSIFLIVLAINDFLAVILVLPVNIFDYLGFHNGFSSIISSDLPCKLLYCFIGTTTQTGSWILVAVTFERFIAVLYPHKVKIYCSRAVTLIDQCIGNLSDIYGYKFLSFLYLENRKQYKKCH